MSSKPLRTVVVGLGQMGRSHALAYHESPEFDIIAFVDRSQKKIPGLESYPYHSLVEALKLRPDLVCIATHTDTHAEYAIAALQAGAHVFVEKPLAGTVAEAQRVVDAAKRANRQLIVGYILRHHPTWIEFISRARKLGPPYVMRMNLNQQSRGPEWATHKRIMELTSPVIDCGVHYLDVMLQITDSRPVQVRGMGVRLSEEIKADQVNYGHLQVVFEDQSVGFYEAGWGPMVSETAYNIKDVFGPKGSVSIINEGGNGSADVSGHTRATKVRGHDAETGKVDEWTSEVEADHDSLCTLEQLYVAQVIREKTDLTRHWNAAVRSLAVVLAADKSMREGRAIDL